MLVMAQIDDTATSDMILSLTGAMGEESKILPSQHLSSNFASIDIMMSTEIVPINQTNARIYTFKQADICIGCLSRYCAQ